MCYLNQTKLTFSLANVPAIGGRERAASGPRQGRIFRASSSGNAGPAKISSFQRLRAMHVLRSQTDLGLQKCGVKQIFPDTARQPRPPTNNKEQTDGRISQTIFRIQSNQAKRKMFPGFSVRHLDRFNAPGLEKYCLDGTANRLYKPYQRTN